MYAFDAVSRGSMHAGHELTRSGSKNAFNSALGSICILGQTQNPVKASTKESERDDGGQELQDTHNTLKGRRVSHAIEEAHVDD